MSPKWVHRRTKLAVKRLDAAGKNKYTEKRISCFAGVRRNVRKDVWVDDDSIISYVATNVVRDSCIHF